MNNPFLIDITHLINLL